MLGRLLKYEFRATGRVFLPFFGALIVVSIISRILGLLSGSTGGGAAAISESPYIIGVVLSIMLMVAVVVVAFILMIQRFSKNLIGDEGYLMFTLPVTVDSLIFSKMIASAVWTVLSAVFVVISVMIMALADLNQLFSSLSKFLGDIFSSDAVNALTCIQVIIFIILTLFSSSLTFYMCISLSMLFNRRRGLASVGIYMLLMTFVQTLTALGAGFISTDLAGFLFGWVGNLSAAGTGNIFLLGMNLVGIVGGGVMYFITRWMLSRKLNLE